MKNLITGIVLIFFFVFVLFFPRYQAVESSLSMPGYLASLLRGEVYNIDLVQEYVGFRGLITNTDAYPKILDGYSTHPPTAFLFGFFTAPFTIEQAGAVWAWMSLIIIGLSLYLMEFPVTCIVPVTILLALWSPVTFSLNQITPIWLVGISLAYQERNRNPFMAGVWIGMAAITKFLPAIMLIPFIVRRQWSALTGFLVTCCISLSVLLLLSPHSIIRYFEVNSGRFYGSLMGEHNASFFPNFFRLLGIPGVVFSAALVAVIIFLNRDSLFRGNISRTAWNFYVLLSVIGLPVCWPYSLLPLIPRLLDQIMVRRPARIFAITVFIIPLLLPPSAYRHIVIPILVLLLFGFIPFDNLFKQKEAPLSGKS
ncbi:MAG TPA: glycosyltransferase family 87 protein [Anaerolineaceae bacterium]|nr:glycosyltransferase family 87 protein [Anaerolineaceae bacterium]HPN53667.1 glycosyltransferase family 87 protein [Anaerolineaceae bacterium]